MYLISFTRTTSSNNCRLYEMFHHYISFVHLSFCLVVLLSHYSFVPFLVVLLSCCSFVLLSLCLVVLLSICLVNLLSCCYIVPLSWCPVGNPRKPEKSWPQLCHWPSSVVSMTAHMDSRDACASEKRKNKLGPGGLYKLLVFLIIEKQHCWRYSLSSVPPCAGPKMPVV